MKPYTIQLDIDGEPCLVVGAGAIGLVKTRSLLDAGARVMVVSRSFHDGFDELDFHDRLEREFDDLDIEGKLLVHAATQHRDINSRIADLCKERGILCCVASDASAGSFSVPAVYQNGDLGITISTGGASPAYGARFRRIVAGQVPDNLQPYLDFLREARDQSKKRIADASLRMRFNVFLASEEGQRNFEKRSDADNTNWTESLKSNTESIPDSNTSHWE